MNPVETHDKDSMMALEALLKIKSNNNNSIPQTPSATGTPTESSARYYASQFSVHHNPITPGLQCIDGQGQNPTVFSIAKTTGLLQLAANHFIPMQIVSAAAQSPPPQVPQFKISSHALGETAIKNSTETMPISIQISTSNNNNNSSIRECTPPLKMETEEVVVRKEKIDAALRSKPQRGRKRDNLSVHERLELTRTRNREHAKSTRIRKKARYQDLVDKESLFDELKSSVDLAAARIETVKIFIACREKLLCASPSADEYRKLLVDTVCDTSSFTFDVNGPQHADAMIRMELFEDILRSKVIQKFGKDAVSHLGYRVVGGPGSIAVGNTGVSLVELSVVLAQDDQGSDQTVMSALLRWTFESESDKLVSMQWTTIQDTLQHVHLEDLTSKDSAKDLLGLQTCYPSVVSLDHGGNSEPQHRSPEEGPGMNI